MTKFTFSEYDIGNSPIVPDQEGSVSFIISTERSLLDQPKTTTLTPSGDTENKALGGAIDWKKKTVEVGGITKPFAEVKHKTGGVFSTTREWQWATKKYTASHSNRTWTMKCGEESIAVLIPLKPHPFKKDELATLTFLSTVSNEEMVFLILALVYPEVPLPVAKKPLTFKAAAGEASTNVAVTVATNAASAGLQTCCTIQ